MTAVSQIHWLTPTIMVLSLLAGCVCALGHHIFYASLAGTPAPTGLYEIAGASISRQQVNTAVGTALGFLVKSLLTTAIGTAFVQAFWYSLQTSREGPTLDSLDSTFSVLSNISGLLRPKAWVGFVIPMLLAIIAWIVPIASIVTPATLSVQSTAVSPRPSHSLPVPKLDFTSQNFAAPISSGDGGYCFNGPSQAVERVAAAVAAQGQILPINSPGPNTTWSLDFWAPTLSCNDAPDSKQTAIWSHVLDQFGNVTDCSYAYGYIAWTAPSNESLPFVLSSAGGTARRLPDTILNYGEPASIYVATLPQMFNFSFMTSDSLTQEKCRFFGSDSLIYTYPIAEDVCLPGLEPPGCLGQQAWLTDASLMQCNLLNATYHVEFEYKDGKQNITVDVDTGYPVTFEECLRSDADSDAVSSKMTSYKALSAAFNQLIIGSITMGGYGTPTKGVDSKLPGVVFNSSIATTVLMETEDLAFVVDFNGVNKSFDYLQTLQADKFPSKRDTTSGARGKLKSALETLFQNFTISLLAEEMLHPNYSSPYAPVKNNEVTFNNYQNIYVYSASTLWAAYSLAIFFALVALALGFRSLLLNNGSFTNDFSTVLRTCRAAALSAELRIEERDGRQPLPERLAKSRIRINEAKNSTLSGKESSTAEFALLPLHGEPD